MFETLKDPNGGKWPSIWEILDFTELIRTEGSEARKYYTYAQLRGFLTIGFYKPYALFTVSHFFNYSADASAELFIGEKEMEKIRNSLIKMDVSNETSFTPQFNLDKEIIEYLKQTRMPDIILEYGRYKIDLLPSKPYVVLHHTKDISTQEAFSRIQSAISPYGKLPK